MLYNLYHFVHNSLGLHFWDLPAILVGVVMIVMLIVHVYNQRRREKKFEKARQEKLEEMRITEEEESVSA